MELVYWFIDIFLHLDKHLAVVIRDYGALTYVLLFVIVFCETGLVVTPILPGDSLLFAAGTFAAIGNLNVWLLFGLLSAAAILGDTANYWIGHGLGPKVFKFKKSRFFNPEHLQRAHAFYERYGGKTIVIARFVPIIRTFAPFVAGVGAMSYPKFLLYNVIGGLAWVALCVTAGYHFANVAVVRNNFSLAILAVVFISILPAIFEAARAYLVARARKPSALNPPGPANPGLKPDASE
jgi:membrane-associated protein